MLEKILQDLKNLKKKKKTNPVFNYVGDKTITSRSLEESFVYYDCCIDLETSNKGLHVEFPVIFSGVLTFV